MLNDDHLKDFVQKTLKKGYTHDQVKNTLLSHGYDKKRVEAVLAEHPVKQIPPSAQPVHSTINRPPLKWKEPFVIIIVILFIAVSIYMLAMSIIVQNPTITDEEFLLQANACLPVTIVVEVKGSLLKLSADQCTLTKKFVSFSSSENTGVVQALQGLTMSCAFDKGTLSKDDLSLLSRLDSCNGPLKDRIIELSIQK